MPKFIRKHPWFFVWTTVILLVTLSFVAGIRLTIDTSTVNQLQHYTQTTRTNDMFNPIIVYNDGGFLEIEVTLPHLSLIDNSFGDCADMLVSYWRIANPITSVYDWFTRGMFIDDFLIWGDELDDYCDTPDGTDTYYTHFYRVWNVPTIAEGFTYAIYLDFYDADCNWWGCETAAMFMEGEWVPGLESNVETSYPPDEEVQEELLACDFISFFEYQEDVPPDVDYTPPTATPTPTPTDGTGTGDNGAGAIGGGWVNQYTILEGMQNWVFLVILVLVIGLLCLIIFFILYARRKNKKKK